VRRMRYLPTLHCAAMLAVACAPALAGERSVGIASFYSEVPASAEAMTAAHPSLPLGTLVRVTRTDTGKTVVLRINDRGPFVRGRIIDVSLRAAEQLEMVGVGLAPVSVEVVDAEVLADAAEFHLLEGCQACEALP